MDFVQYKLHVKFILYTMFPVLCSQQSDSELAIQTSYHKAPNIHD